jgi:Holliday junction resolvase-like predicted endonuclease
VGDEAEAAVATILGRAGWRVLARNVRIDRDEIDIVAVEPGDPDTLVLVEVRSRTAPSFGPPEESVDARKVARLYRAAWALVRGGLLPGGVPLPAGPWRVDLVTLGRDGASAPWHVRAHLRGLQPP